MKKKNLFSKFLASFLTLAIVCMMLPMSVFAEALPTPTISLISEQTSNSFRVDISPGDVGYVFNTEVSIFTEQPADIVTATNPVYHENLGMSFHNVTGLQPETTYYVYARTHVSSDISEWSVCSTAITLAAAPPTYTVTFNANGGKFSDGQSTKTVPNVASGTMLSDIEGKPENPTREGYVFRNWDTSNFSHITNGITNNMTFNAAWNLPAPTNLKATKTTEESITLTWDEVTVATGYKIYKTVNNTQDPEIPTAEATYTFNGLDENTEYKFSIAAHDNSTRSESASIKVTTLAAVPTYTIYLNLEGGTVEVNSQSASYHTIDNVAIGTELSTLYTGTPVKDGFTFIGWSDGSSDETLVTSTTAATNYYAIWNIIKPTNGVYYEAQLEHICDLLDYSDELGGLNMTDHHNADTARVGVQNAVENYLSTNGFTGITVSVADRTDVDEAYEVRNDSGSRYAVYNYELTLTAGAVTFTNSYGGTIIAEKTDPTPTPDPIPTPKPTPTPQPQPKPEDFVTTPDSSGKGVEIETVPQFFGAQATVDVLVKQIDKAIELATGEEPTIEIKVQTAPNIDTVQVEIPAVSVEKIAEEAKSELKITSGVAEVTFDVTAVAAIASQASGDEITLVVEKIDENEKATDLTKAQQAVVADNPVYELYLVSNGKKISDFNGGDVTVIVPEKLAPAAGKPVYVYYISDDGVLEQVEAVYDGVSQKLTFKTLHFSNYLISIVELNETNIGNASSGASMTDDGVSL